MGKRIFLLTCLLITACLFTNVKAALLKTPDGNAVYDNQSNLFWYADLSEFRDLTYSQQINSISAMTGNWHMATFSDYETLALNEEVDIFNTFKPLDSGYLSYDSPNDTLINLYQGRIDEPIGDSPSGTHKFLQMSYNVTDNTVFYPLSISATDWKDEWHGSTGAWIASDSYSQLIDGTVTTRKSYEETLLLGDTFSFDYWWQMGQEPAGLNFDIMYFRDNSWQLLGGDINFDGSSSAWATRSFVVPENLRGLNTQIRFMVYDLGDVTDPTVYLRNIASNGTAPVPEPATMLLLGTGLLGLAGFRKKFKK